MLQQAAYKWQPLEHAAYCRPTHFHLSMSPTKLRSWNTGLLLRIENLKNFSSYAYVYTIHNACTYQCYAPLHPKLGYSGAGGNLTDLNVNSPYSGADPVIKFPRKDGTWLGISLSTYAVWSNHFPDYSGTLFSQLPNRGIVGHNSDRCIIHDLCIRVGYNFCNLHGLEFYVILLLWKTFKSLLNTLEEL